MSDFEAMSGSHSPRQPRVPVSTLGLLLVITFTGCHCKAAIEGYDTDLEKSQDASVDTLADTSVDVSTDVVMDTAMDVSTDPMVDRMEPVPNECEALGANMLCGPEPSCSMCFFENCNTANTVRSCTNVSACDRAAMCVSLEGEQIVGFNDCGVPTEGSMCFLRDRAGNTFRGRCVQNQRNLNCQLE